MRHPKATGEISEAIVISEMIKIGLVVSLPFGDNQRYDMVVDNGKGLFRCQCKTGRLRGGAIKFNACSTRSNTKGSHKTTYQGQADLFAVWCQETGCVYVVPIPKDGGNRYEINLRVEPPRNNQVLGISQACTYELSRRVYL